MVLTVGCWLALLARRLLIKDMCCIYEAGKNASAAASGKAQRQVRKRTRQTGDVLINGIFEISEAEGSQSEQGSNWSETLNDLIGRDGRIVDVNLTELKALGLEPEILIGAPLERIYSAESIQSIDKAFEELQDSQTRVMPKLQLIRGDGGLIDVCAFVRLEKIPADGRSVLRLEKTDQLLSEPELENLRHQNMILEGFFSTTQDACWCIEYPDPVDLEAPDTEVVRQVFENSSRWAACNPAMERMYGLPEGLAFGDQGIRVYFPRNAGNEKFVELLIESGFSVAGAPATDLRHDGTIMHVENDVEAFIRNGKLYRMWGTVRDVSERIENDREINDQWAVMSNILDVLPFPLIVVDRASLIEAVNPALEELSHLPVHSLLNRNVSLLFEFSEDIEKIWQEFERGSKKVKVDAHIRDGKDSSVKLAVFAAIVDGIEGEIRYVLTFGTPLLF